MPLAIDGLLGALWLHQVRTAPVPPAGRGWTGWYHSLTSCSFAVHRLPSLRDFAFQLTRLQVMLARPVLRTAQMILSRAQAPRAHRAASYASEGRQRTGPETAPMTAEGVICWKGSTPFYLGTPCLAHTVQHGCRCWLSRAARRGSRRSLCCRACLASSRSDEPS